MAQHPPTPDECPGPDQGGPAASLHERIGTLESSVRILATGHVTLTEQMAEMTVSMTRQDKRINALRDDLKANSDATLATLQAAREIKDIVTTGRTMGRLARWAAPSLVAAAVAIGVLKGWAVDVGQAIKAAGQK